MQKCGVCGNQTTNTINGVCGDCYDKGDDCIEYPPVLDACCGTRMFWFDKSDPMAIYIDKRKGRQKVNRPGRSDMVVAPDQIADFRKMPFPDDTFYHVVFDPPHLKHVGNGNLGFSYGRLDGDWKNDFRLGFAECFRVLKPYGTLIFKWCETDYPLKEVLALTEMKPLYGHRSGKLSKTHWVAFLKK